MKLQELDRNETNEFLSLAMGHWQLQPLLEFNPTTYTDYTTRRIFYAVSPDCTSTTVAVTRQPAQQM
jgi:hypothetical protein